jgi:hypothetical protein
MKIAILGLATGLGLLTMTNSHAQEFTVLRRNTVQSHVDDEGCTITTRNEYVDSSYHGRTKEDVWTTTTTSRPEIYIASLNKTCPEIYQTESNHVLGDWSEPKTAAFSPSVPSTPEVRSAVIVYEGAVIAPVNNSKTKARIPTTEADDLAEYRNNVKSGKWKEFKNGD